MYSHHNIVNFIINFNFLNCNLLFKGTVQTICAESAV